MPCSATTEEAYRKMLEVQLAELVERTSVQPAPPSSFLTKSSVPLLTPRGTSKGQVRGVVRSASADRGGVRSASVDSKRPREIDTGSFSRATLRQSRAQQPSCGSLLRAASLTSRPNMLWDPRQSIPVLSAKSENAGEVLPAKVAPVLVVRDSEKENRKDAILTEPDPEQTPPSSSRNVGLGVGARRPRPSTASVGNTTLVSPRAKAGPQRMSSGKAAFGRAAVGHQPRSPRDSFPSAAAAAPRELGSAKAAQEKAPEKDAEVLSRERERARTARVAVSAMRQTAQEDTRTRQEEQRRRAAAIRERARVDREAARLSARAGQPAAAAISTEVLESAWVSG